MDYTTSCYRAWAVVTVPQALINQLGLSLFSIGAIPVFPGLTGVLGQLPVDIELELGKYNVDWELNAIPNAHMTAVVGRLATDMQQVAAIHRIVHRLKEMVPISLYIAMDASSMAPTSEANAWPERNTVRIFRGYVASTGFRRQDESLEFVINAVHWLRDLTFSSALSRSSHHMNPGQMSFNAAFPDIAVSGGVSLAPHATTDTMPGNFFPANVVQEDFWGYQSRPVAGSGFRLGGLKSFMQQLSSVDRIFTTPRARQVFGQPVGVLDEKNWEALRALQHIEPGARYMLPDFGPEVVENGYVDGVPLAMDLTGPEAVAARHIATAIGLTMGRETFSTIAANTLWDKLIGQYAPLFLFSVVPMVEKALIVPFTPGLRWDGTKRGSRLFTTQDYNHFEYISQNTALLRAVFLMTGMSFSTGFDTGRDNAPAYSLFGPKYISPSSANSGGLVMFKEAPRWLTDLGVPFLYPSMVAPFSTAHDSANENTLVVLLNGVSAVLLQAQVPSDTVSQILEALTNSVNLGNRNTSALLTQISLFSGIVRTSPVLQGILTVVLDAAVGAMGGLPRISSVYAGMTGLWDRYAQSLYIQEKTKGRQGTLSGRFRLDTAPGTVVKIETNSGDLPLVATCTGDGQCSEDEERYLYGVVLRVSCWMDAQSNQQGTSFQIGFMHDSYEEAVSDTSVPRHPVWAQSWWGAPLVVERNPLTDRFRHWGTPTMAPSSP